MAVLGASNSSLHLYLGIFTITLYVFKYACFFQVFAGMKDAVPYHRKRHSLSIVRRRKPFVSFGPTFGGQELPIQHLQELLRSEVWCVKRACVDLVYHSSYKASSVPNSAVPVPVANARDQKLWRCTQGRRLASVVLAYVRASYTYFWPPEVV